VPVVRVTFFEGRSDEQKRELAEVITEAMGRIAGSQRDGVNVIFEEVPKSDWFIGGILATKRARA
jgi:4-oxalocrotonate tautomerase